MLKRRKIDEFLTAYKRSNVTGNYAAVCAHNQPKGVGKKPGNPKRKGPSQCKKPEFESYVDPFGSETDDAMQTFTCAPGTADMSHALPQSHAFNQLQYPSASSLSWLPTRVCTSCWGKNLSSGSI